ncbi:MAG: transposase [Thermodesulfobacteriota bacterium]
MLVTLRARDGVGWLRTRLAYGALEAALAASSRNDFRVAEFSVQTSHLHLVVEADGRAALTRDMRGLAIRCARAVNRALGRCGALWGERYHARALSTPRAVRTGLLYVIANARKHGRVRAGIDPCSSARWFDGFRWPRGGASPDAGLAPGERATRSPRTWLLRVGWRRHGLLSPDEGPAPPARARSR